jgi:GGDEF domain-containing protein
MSRVSKTGWRTVAAPAAFAAAALALLVFGRAHGEVRPLALGLGAALVATVLAWAIQSSRRRSREAADGVRDPVTGLSSRSRLNKEIEEPPPGAGGRRALLLFEVDYFHAFSDRFGQSAGDEMLRRAAQLLDEVGGPLGGTAYRVEESRLALLVPAGDSQLAEVVLAATAALQDEGGDLLFGRSYGEVAIPEEATEPGVALQIAGQRLAAHSQRQHHSARRQAHAVLMAVLETRRPELRRHLRTVAYRAISLARRLGMPMEEIDDVALAAELQDIGLLAVPETVLEEEGPLTEQEVALIHTRPVVAERIIGAAPGLAPVAALVRSSAEHFDGSGFPDGLAGEAIPLGSRVVAVAVAYAAITAPRPHRDAATPREALEELRRGASTQFDPGVVDALTADLIDELRRAPAASA